MSGIGRCSNLVPPRGLFALIALALLCATTSGCSGEKARQEVMQPAKGGTVASTQGGADRDLPGVPQGTAGPPGMASEEPEEPEDEDEMESPSRDVEHHHHHFALTDRLPLGPVDRASGVIHWPMLLRKPQFSDLRYKLDQLFHQRGPGNSGLKSKNYEEVKANCQAMLGILDQMIEELTMEEFLAACGFIKDLEQEARLAVE